MNSWEKEECIRKMERGKLMTWQRGESFVQEGTRIGGKKPSLVKEDNYICSQGGSILSARCHESGIVIYKFSGKEINCGGGRVPNQSPEKRRIQPKSLCVKEGKGGTVG